MVKVRGHSVRKIAWKQMDGQMKAIALPPMITWSVISLTSQLQAELGSSSYYCIGSVVDRTVGWYAYGNMF